MVNMYYTGFNGYQQCPVNDNLPKVLNAWVEFTVRDLKLIECGFKNVAVGTGDEIIVYGYVKDGDDTRERKLRPPNGFDAVCFVDDTLIASKGCDIWKYTDKWEKYFSNVKWSDKNIVKMCYLLFNEEVLILLSDGSVWRLDKFCEVRDLFLPVLDKCVDICCGFEHGLILTENGCVLSFGNGSRGQLGHGDLNPSTEPLQVLGLGGLKVVKIACGGWHSAAVTDIGDVYLWGWNSYGQITDIEDDGSLSALPMLIEIDGVISVDCGARHTVILTESGAFATGWNEYGQLGVDENKKILNKFTKINLKGITGNGKIKCGPWSTIIYI